jgi:hypothetical protein
MAATNLLRSTSRTALEQSLQQAKAGNQTGKLQELSREELYERAQEADVAGHSSMSKDQLVDALGKR